MHCVFDLTVEETGGEIAFAGGAEHFHVRVDFGDGVFGEGGEGFEEVVDGVEG
jgi:hypothetical protein